MKRVSLWLSVAVGIVAVVALLVWVVTNTPAGNNSQVKSLEEDDWIKGSAEAQVTIIEYSDFQCPACAAYHPILKQLIEEFNGEARLVYRHLPLKAIHKNTELAARAAEAAGKQDKFWEMHDELFNNQEEWAESGKAENLFLGYAEVLGLDGEQFVADLNSKEVKNKVNEDYLDAVSSGLNSTPSFFLNGERIQNPRGYDEFRKLIQSNIQGQ